VTIFSSDISPTTQAPIDLVAEKNAVRARLNDRLDEIDRLLGLRKMLWATAWEAYLAEQDIIRTRCKQ
jgi:predicted nicotinamide N-methyase